MPPGVRRFALTAHVTSSVGWLGAVVAFLALTAAGLASGDAQVVRAVYVAAEPVTRFAIVPLALASLLTGIVQSLGTSWGLLRHYWVVIKLLLTLFATLVLLQYTRTVSYFAGVASTPDGSDPAGLWSYLLHSGVALALLLVATVLAVYKPRGLTRYGRRRQREQRAAPNAAA